MDFWTKVGMTTSMKENLNKQTVGQTNIYTYRVSELNNLEISKNSASQIYRRQDTNYGKALPSKYYIIVALKYELQ